MRRSKVWMTAVFVATLLSAAHSQDDLLKVNVEREKQLIEGHMREFSDLVVAANLQQARATLRLIEDRMTVVKKELQRPVRQDLETRIAALVSAMRQKEDSLVAVVKTKFDAEGLDAAIEYSQQVLRRIGLPEERFAEIDRFILEEAPKLQQRKEAASIDRAVQALEAGRGVPDDVDPYLAMTARQIVQDRRDSVRAVQQAERDRSRRGDDERARKEAAEQVKRDERTRDSLEAVRAERERERKELEAAARERDEQLRREQEELERVRKQQDQKLAEVEDKRQAEAVAQVEEPPPVTFRTEYRAAEDTPADTASQREQEERDRQARIEAARREEERVAAIDRLNRGQTPFGETASASGNTASVREYMQQRKVEEKKAQEIAVQVYSLIEKGRPDEALSLFRGRREFLGQYLTKEVFVILERSVVASKGENAEAEPAAGTAPTLRELPREEQHVLRIRQYLKDRRWDTAVSLFDGTKKELKAYLTKEEYKKLAETVESAREYAKKK